MKAALPVVSCVREQGDLRGMRTLRELQIQGCAHEQEARSPAAADGPTGAAVLEAAVDLRDRFAASPFGGAQSPLHATATAVDVGILQSTWKFEALIVHAECGSSSLPAELGVAHPLTLRQASRRNVLKHRLAKCVTPKTLGQSDIWVLMRPGAGNLGSRRGCRADDLACHHERASPNAYGYRARKHSDFMGPLSCVRNCGLPAGLFPATL